MIEEHYVDSWGVEKSKEDAAGEKRVGGRAVRQEDQSERKAKNLILVRLTS